MEKGRERDKKAREHWDRVADYFDQIAETLEKMIKSFKQKEIPRIQGNKLKELNRNFNEIVHSIYSPDEDEDRKKSSEALAELHHTAIQATNIDMQYTAIGYDDDTIHGSSADQIIAKFERVAGKYRGLAVALRAKTPYKKK